MHSDGSGLNGTRSRRGNQEDVLVLVGGVRMLTVDGGRGWRSTPPTYGTPKKMTAVNETMLLSRE